MRPTLWCATVAAPFRPKPAVLLAHGRGIHHQVERAREDSVECAAPLARAVAVGRRRASRACLRTR